MPYLLAALSCHICPPVGLAKLGMSLHHKLKALLHQLRLECAGLQELRECLTSIASITTDQGRRFAKLQFAFHV